MASIINLIEIDNYETIINKLLKKGVLMDRRVQYTKRVIKETLLELLEEKDITKVTVMELCKKSDINRATFYRYYLDIFDVLEKMEEEFVQEFKNSYKDFDYTHNQLYDYVLALLQACQNNKKLIKILFNTKNGISFLNDVLEDAYIRCKEKWEHDLPGIKEEQEEYATAYLFNGTLGIVNYWIQNNFDKDIEEIASIVKDLSYYGTNKFIYQK